MTPFLRFRGIDKAHEQCLMAACAQNIKKMALLLDREGFDRLFPLISGLLGRICADLKVALAPAFQGTKKIMTPKAALC